MPLKHRTLTADDFLIKKSSIKGIGLGLFAKKRIYKGETIGGYTGKIISDAQANREPYLSSHYVLWICKNYSIVAEGVSASYTRYINHKDNPNARFVVSTRWKKARVEAIKRINSGEEIFLDYGPWFWESSEVKKKNA
jgi:SET domain-containing protein